MAGIIQMSGKRAIENRRKRLELMLQDGIPVSTICHILEVTPQTLYSDWHTIQEKWEKEGWTDELIPPHTTYRLAICTKIDLLTRLRTYNQWSIANILGISQSHVSKLKRWAEVNGMYGDTGIRIVVTTDDVLTVDKSKTIERGTYVMKPANHHNVFLTADDTHYIVRCADLVDAHELVSPYLYDWEHHRVVA
jgi:tellurite resistance-related uncharacterized protein